MKKLLIFAALVALGLFGYRSLAKNSAAGASGPVGTAGKLTLLDFTGSDWCGWCMKLDQEVFSQPEFQQFARDNVILTKVDFPRQIPQSAAERARNTELAKQYGVRGYPTIIVLNAQGKQVGRLGYMPGGPRPFIDALKRLPRS